MDSRHEASMSEQALQKRDWTPSPLVAAAFSTLCCVGVVLAGTLVTRGSVGRFLLWNLFLAWVPVGFAWLATRPGNSRSARWGWGMLWLLFFPNAPYIFTDMVHLGDEQGDVFWVRLGVLLLFAMTGLFAGFLSLHRMQQLVTEHFGAWVGWAVVLVCCGLGSAGVAMGRFMRWNSWDAVVRPVHLVEETLRWFWDLRHDPMTGIFLALFSLFLVLSYLMFHAMGCRAQR